MFYTVEAQVVYIAKTDYIFVKYNCTGNFFCSSWLYNKTRRIWAIADLVLRTSSAISLYTTRVRSDNYYYFCSITVHAGKLLPTSGHRAPV